MRKVVFGRAEKVTGVGKVGKVGTGELPLCLILDDGPSICGLGMGMVDVMRRLLGMSALLMKIYCNVEVFAATELIASARFIPFSPHSCYDPALSRLRSVHEG